MRVQFVVSESSKSLFKTLGLNSSKIEASKWPLQAGDFISFSEVPSLFWRVLSRVLVLRTAPEQSEWLVLLEKAEDPLSALEPREN